MQSEYQAHHMREYETIFILEAQVSKDQAERVVQRVSEVMTARDGRLVKVDYWGKRRLAHRIRRNQWGFYYHVRYLGYGGLVAELERNFRMLDPVLRFQTIVLKDDVDASGYQPAAGDLEFHVDLLLKEAAEPVKEPEQPGAVVSPVPVGDGRPAAEASGAETGDADKDDESGEDEEPGSAAADTGKGGES